MTRWTNKYGRVGKYPDISIIEYISVVNKFIDTLSTENINVALLKNIYGDIYDELHESYRKRNLKISIMQREEFHKIIEYISKKNFDLLTKLKSFLINSAQLHYLHTMEYEYSVLIANFSYFRYFPEDTKNLKVIKSLIKTIPVISRSTLEKIISEAKNDKFNTYNSVMENFVEQQVRANNALHLFARAIKRI